MTGLTTMSQWLPSFSQHLTWSAIALLVYVLTTRARGARRAPTTAIAWVMGLALLPYLVLPLFLAFGQRKFRAVRHPPTVSPSSHGHWAAALLDSFGLEPPTPVRTRFHADGAQAREALWEIFQGARRRLDVCTFIIGDDAFGREVLEVLAHQARHGVQVRLLLDGFGALSVPRHYLQALEAAGGQVAVFRPLFAWRRMGPRNLRNHRKLVIADGIRLWAGGRNLAAEYFEGRDGRPPWTDLSFDLTGAVAAAASRQFETDWAGALGQQPLRTSATVGVEGESLAQFLPSGPDQAEDTAQALLVDACFRARNRLMAVTPYFVPDDNLRTAMRLATRRGVHVTLLLPVASNHRLTDFARARALRELAAAGADIRLLPQMAHAKAVVVDDALALCGSINLDLRSLLLNYESAVVFYGAADIAWLTKWIDELAMQGAPFVARPPGLLRDIGEGLLLTIAFQL